MNRAHLALCLALLPATGCVFYADDDCDYGGGALGAPIEPNLLRNPDTGGCQEFGYGGGGGTVCGDPVPEQDERAPDPDWGQCQSVCTGLDEYSCLATPACRGAYVGTCAADASCQPGDGQLAFAECWAVAPSGPIQGGSCAALGAYDCSRHDDCAAIHYPLGGMDSPSGDQKEPGIVQAIGNFQFCAAEPAGCYSDADCGGGSCNADELCLAPPGCGSGSGGNEAPCPAVCYGYCVPDKIPTGHCYGEVACRSLPPVCPEGSRPGISGLCWSGECIPLDQCPEGTCDGTALCDAPEPICPDGTVPGIANGCYTGFCIPANQCEVVAACEELAEVGCIGRDDCAPYYEGVNCECTGDACICEDWLFMSCQSLSPLPG